MTVKTMTTRLAVLLAAFAAALFVSACTNPEPEHDHGAHDHGTETSTVEGQPADFNDADVAFATMMIPHHEQAVELSNMVPAHTTDPELIKLAETIAGAQGPEIEVMKVFLVQWNGGEGDGAGGHEGHEGHDMSGMQGMVDTATMEKLQTLNGEEFDRLWLQSMIAHHEGTIEMANTEIADGVNADAKGLAERIVIAQQAEITSMKQMLGD